MNVEYIYKKKTFLKCFIFSLQAVNGAKNSKIILTIVFSDGSCSNTVNSITLYFHCIIDNIQHNKSFFSIYCTIKKRFIINEKTHNIKFGQFGSSGVPMHEPTLIMCFLFGARTIEIDTKIANTQDNIRSSNCCEQKTR